MFQILSHCEECVLINKKKSFLQESTGEGLLEKNWFDMSDFVLRQRLTLSQSLFEDIAVLCSFLHVHR